MRPYIAKDREPLVEIFKLNTPQYFDIKEADDFLVYLDKYSET